MTKEHRSDAAILSAIKASTDEAKLLQIGQQAYLSMTPREQERTNRALRSLMELPKVGPAISLEILAAIVAKTVRQEREGV